MFPDRPSELTLVAFLRVPLEGLVLVALAAVLPVRFRRAVALLLGVILGLVVIFKVLDIGFFTAFERPFDPLGGDTGYAAIGIETLGFTVGRTAAKLIAVGVVAGAVALVLATTLSMLRLSEIAARNPRFSLRAVAALGSVWLVCWLAGAQLVSRSPIASTSMASLVVREVKTAKAEIHDKGVFAKEIKHDTFRNTPANKLLTALRGKDVLLVFLEAYGQVAVQNSSFSPGIDAMLENETKQLLASGFSARSGFLKSSTFGGVSWLAHSTLESGRLGRQHAALQPTVEHQPLHAQPGVPEGPAGASSMTSHPTTGPGRKGKSTTTGKKSMNGTTSATKAPPTRYASMPDQYMFLRAAKDSSSRQAPPASRCLRRSTLAPSHMPWNRVLDNVIPWNSGRKRIDLQRRADGKELGRGVLGHSSSACASRPTRTRSSTRCGTIVSFLKHYGAAKNLVYDRCSATTSRLSIVSGEEMLITTCRSPLSPTTQRCSRRSRAGIGAPLQDPAWNAPVWPMSTPAIAFSPPSTRKRRRNSAAC